MDVNNSVTSYPAIVRCGIFPGTGGISGSRGTPEFGVCTVRAADGDVTVAVHFGGYGKFINFCGGVKFCKGAGVLEGRAAVIGDVHVQFACFPDGDCYEVGVHAIGGHFQQRIRRVSRPVIVGDIIPGGSAVLGLQQKIIGHV